MSELDTLRYVKIKRVFIMIVRWLALKSGNSTEKVLITKHARTRMKERNGTGKHSCDKVIQRAYTDGIKHSETKGNLNKWITRIWAKNKKADNIRLYGDKAYIFCDRTLVTVLRIPSNLMEEKASSIKKYRRGRK